MFDQYQYFLVLDLEATCCNKKTIPRREMEMIEIGAVMVEQKSLKVIDEYQTFIKPVRHPILTPFCKNLTTITQEQIDNAPIYPEASLEFKKWLALYDNYLFGSWGDFDRIQFEQDSKYHKVPYPIAGDHVNLKAMFTDNQGLYKNYGMAGALKLTNMGLDGTHHRGIDDARNIAKLMPFILGYEKAQENSF